MPLRKAVRPAGRNNEHREAGYQVSPSCLVLCYQPHKKANTLLWEKQAAAAGHAAQGRQAWHTLTARGPQLLGFHIPELRGPVCGQHSQLAWDNCPGCTIAKSHFAALLARLKSKFPPALKSGAPDLRPAALD